MGTTWQFEFRYGAFYIFPTDGIIEAIDALRRNYDPKSADRCQAHISLSEPLSQPLTVPHVHELQVALQEMAAFDMRYGSLRSFPPHPGVVYSIQPEDAFRQLRSIVHATSLFASVPLRRNALAPHMTIAEFITIERTKACYPNRIQSLLLT